MARIISLDYGVKKCGIAATDPLQIIVSPIGTYPTSELLAFLKQYFQEEEVEKIVIGKPTHRDGTPTYLQGHIDKFVVEVKKLNEQIEIDFIDESYTSQEAKEIIFQSGVKKKKRRDKTLVDKISAVLILQKYLRHI